MDDEVVQAILVDWRLAPINDKLRAMLGFLEKVTLTPAAVSPKDVLPLRKAGLNDKAIEEALYVNFLFNLINRLADALDFPSHDDKGFRVEAQLLYKLGYGIGSVPG